MNAGAWEVQCLPRNVGGEGIQERSHPHQTVLPSSFPTQLHHRDQVTQALLSYSVHHPQQQAQLVARLYPHLQESRPLN